MGEILFSIAFGEMELSSFTYYSIISIGVIFVVCFALASIPLAQNMKSSKKR
tara:strand:- start:334 stop:489 length:156 start_codon:yes stop_codon:yes gene_type:complete